MDTFTVSMYSHFSAQITIQQQITAYDMYGNVQDKRSALQIYLDIKREQELTIKPVPFWLR